MFLDAIIENAPGDVTANEIWMDNNLFKLLKTKVNEFKTGINFIQEDEQQYILYKYKFIFVGHCISNYITHRITLHNIQSYQFSICCRLLQNFL